MNKFIIILISILFFGPFCLKANKSTVQKDSWTPEQRKAEYLFLEGLRMKSLGRMDAFYDLVKRANEIDSSNTAISYYYGYCQILMNNKDKVKAKIALDFMKKHVDMRPSDYYENSFYADIVGKLGYPEESLRVWKRLADLYPTKDEIKYQLADGYARTNDKQMAIDTYNSLEKIEGKSIAISVKKISFFLSLNDTINAIGEAQSLIKSNPKNITFLLLLGDLYAQLGKPDSALVCYNNAEKIEPDNGMVYLSKASYYNSLKDSVNYDREIYKALINPNLEVENKLNVLTDYIRQLLQDNDSSARIDNLFKVLITQHPHEVTIHELYSQYLGAIKNYKGAGEQLSYALDLDPTNSENWRKLMFVYLMAEDYPKAIEAGEKALNYNPDNIELYQFIAPAYFQMKEYQKALKVYNQALATVDTTDVQIMSNIYGGIGDVYFSLKDTTGAFKQYEKALDYDPGNTSILNNYAYFLAESGKDLDKAEKMSAIAVKGSPNNATFLDTYAWVYFKKKEYKLAKIYIESALEKNEEENADLYEHYGDILFMTGDPDKALENWTKALKINPNSDILNRKVKFKTYFYK